jgi:hypothetical protein
MRLHNLDYLRGFTAFGILLNHFILTRGTFNSESFLGKSFIYSISIFYVLNGFLSKNLIIINFLLIASLTFFVLFAVSGDAIMIGTKSNSIIFTITCFLICFYKIWIILPKVFHVSLVKISYSVYLRHPIIYRITIKIDTTFFKDDR